MPTEVGVEAPRYYRVREAARGLNLSPWSGYMLCSDGTLAVHRTGPRGRTLRIAESDLREHLARARSVATRAASPVIPADTPKRRKAKAAKAKR